MSVNSSGPWAEPWVAGGPSGRPPSGPGSVEARHAGDEQARGEGAEHGAEYLDELDLS